MMLATIGRNAFLLAAFAIVCTASVALVNRSEERRVGKEC